MIELAGYQRRALRGQAHDLDPVAHVGKDGVSDALLKSVSQALDAHELIKVRFVDHKEEKKQLALELAEKLEAALAGTVGHVAILYRPHPEPDKRRVRLPDRDQA